MKSAFPHNYCRGTEVIFYVEPLGTTEVMPILQDGLMASQWWLPILIVSHPSRLTMAQAYFVAQLPTLLFIDPLIIHIALL